MTANTVKKFLFEHSFSIVMGAVCIASTIWFFYVEPGHMYDFLNMVGGISGGGFVLAIAGRWLYEKDADVTKPPPPLD